MELIHSLVKAIALIKARLPQLVSIIFLLSIGKAFAFTESHSLALYRAAKIEVKENCQLALRPKAKNRFFKAKANLAQISQKTEILEFLKSYNVNDKYLEDLSARLEKLFQYRALFSNGIISNAIISALEKQFSIDDKNSLAAYLQNFSAQNLSTQNEIMSSTMDSIAVTFHTLLTHEAKNLSSSLEIPTPELINLQSYLKLYLKDDPALFFLELSIRFIIEKQADFFSDQWNSLFKWLRTHKGKAPYEAILKVPSNPFKNLFERVEDEDEEEFKISSIATFKSLDGILNLNLSLDTQQNPALGQFIYIRHGELLNLKQLKSLAVDVEGQWNKELHSHLLDLIHKLQQFKSLDKKIKNPEETLASQKDLKMKLLGELDTKERNFFSTVRKLRDFLNNPKQSYQKKEGEDYFSFESNKEIEDIEAEIVEINEAISQLQIKFQSLEAGFPKNYEKIPKDILDKADHFYNRVEELLIEFDHQSFGDKYNEGKITNNTSGDYCPADRVFELLKKYVQENYSEISFDDFYAGISKLLSIMTGGFETRRITKITILIRAIIQEYPMTRVELRRIINEVAVNLRTRLLYRYAENSLLEEYYNNENTWWNKSKRESGRNKSTESLKNANSKKIPPTVEKRKALENELRKLNLKLSEAQTKAISHYKKALEEAIAEFVEHLNSIQKQKTQVQRDLQLVTSELTIIGKRIESQRAQLLEEHSILLLSNQIIPAQRQN
jgi:hypothetical protein